jgi:hypothetical protein
MTERAKGIAKGILLTLFVILLASGWMFILASAAEYNDGDPANKLVPIADAENVQKYLNPCLAAHDLDQTKIDDLRKEAEEYKARIKKLEEELADNAKVLGHCGEHL